jgi:hypothetical protein
MGTVFISSDDCAFPYFTACGSCKESTPFCSTAITVCDVIRPKFSLIFFIALPGDLCFHFLFFLLVFLQRCPVDGTAQADQSAVRDNFLNLLFHVTFRPGGEICFSFAIKKYAIAAIILLPKISSWRTSLSDACIKNQWDDFTPITFPSS